MRQNGDAGFALWELVAVVLAAGALGCVLLVVLDRGRRRADTEEAGWKGHGIWSAVAQAEAERGAAGGGTLWPSDGMGFADSTAYFRWLVEGERVEGLGYGSLAGSGVPVGKNGCFAPENNMWTVAQGRYEELDEFLPVLVTRNVDATSLATPGSSARFGWRLRFDGSWRVPFGDAGFVLVRKNGAVFRGVDERMGYRLVYGLVREPEEGRGAVRYLTPLYTVEPGDGVYEAGLPARYRRENIRFWRIRHEVDVFAALLGRAGVFWALVYLMAGVWAVVGRLCRGEGVVFFWGWGALAGLHFCAVCLYSVYVYAVLYPECGCVWRWPVGLAVLCQLSGAAVVLARRWDDRVGLLRELTWVVSPPFFVAGVWLGLWVLAGLFSAVWGCLYFA